MKNLQLSVFDLVLAVVLAIGLVRGRKRGISEELLDVLQWVAVVVTAAFTYRLLGGLLIQYVGLPPIYAHLLGYLVAAIVVISIFKSIKRAVGDKLVQGDTFGRMEFHLGMAGGAVRMFCMLLFALAMLYAKYSTPAMRAAAAAAQTETFGTGFFPSLDGVQQMVFFESYSGPFIRTNLSALLIQPVPPGPPRPDTSIKSKREKAVNDAISGGR